MMNIDDEGLVKLNALDTIENHAAIIGMTGSGKTHFMKVLALELSSDIKLTIVDPEGDYSDLRFSRKTLVVGKGFPGQHIDIELAPDNAAAAADVLCHYDMPIVILNLSGFEIDDQDAFVLAYVEQLWKNYRFEENLPPHRLIIDEVQLFAPQTEKTLSKYLLRDMARRARKRSLTLAVATQEPQAVYKPLLNAANYRIFLQVAKGTAMDAIKRLLPASVVNAPGKTDVQDMIASMNRGDALFMIGNNAKKIHIRAAATPVMGQLPMDDGTVEKLRQLIGANKIADDIKADVKREVENDQCIEDLKAETERLKEENSLLRAENQRLLQQATGVNYADEAYIAPVMHMLPVAPGVLERDVERQKRVERLDLDRQTRGFKNLMLVISHQSRLHRQILSYLVDHDPLELDTRDLGIRVGLSPDTHYSLTALVKAKLITGRKVGRKMLYSTDLLKRIARDYPLIDLAQAVDDIARQAKR